MPVKGLTQLRWLPVKRALDDPVLHWQSDEARVAERVAAEQEAGDLVTLDPVDVVAHPAFKNLDNIMSMQCFLV